MEWDEAWQGIVGTERNQNRRYIGKRGEYRLWS